MNVLWCWSSVIICSIMRVNGFLDPGWIEDKFQLIGNQSKHTVTFTKSLFAKTKVLAHVDCRNEDNGKVATFLMGGLISYKHCQSSTNVEQIPDATWSRVELKCLSASEPSMNVLKFLQGTPKSLHPNTTKNSSVIFNKQSTRHRGFYRIDLVFSRLRDADSRNFKVLIEARGSNGFLSVVDWPVLLFHGIMSCIYLGLGIAWFVAFCCCWSTILDVQSWMFSVVLLGLLEHILFYIVYRNLNQSGEVVHLLYFAVVCCVAKRTIAFVSIMLVCRGYGIVRPQYGRALLEVLAVCALYLILGTIEMVGSINRTRFVGRELQVITPLTVLQFLMWVHIFLSIYRTRKIISIRNDDKKLNLYLRFLFILIFVVSFQLAYKVWFIRESSFTDCVDVEVLWLLELIPPCVFVLVLSCILMLWKPTRANDLYAFQPLDVEDYAEEDMTMSRYTVHDTYKNSKS